METAKRKLQEYRESINGYRKVLRAQKDSISRYRHDLVKHIRILKALNKKAQMQEDIYCENEVVNVILAMKAKDCEEKGIPFLLQVQNSGYSGIREIDLAAIIENLLDNAIEAQNRQNHMQEQRIYFSLRRTEEQVLIELENTISQADTGQLTFKTGKKNSEAHGIGTQIIDRLAKKYNGENLVAIDWEHKIFRQRICLMITS